MTYILRIVMNFIINRNSLRLGFFGLFLSAIVSLAQSQEDFNERYDVRIKISENYTIDQIGLEPIPNKSINTSGTIVINNYNVTYIKPNNFDISIFNSTKGYFETSSTRNKSNAAIDVGYWNFLKSFNYSSKTLSNKKLNSNGSTSIVKLFIDYYNSTLIQSSSYKDVFLFAIPSENNRNIDSLFAGFEGKFEHQSRVLFILWRKKTKSEHFPDLIQGLDIAITNLKTGDTKYYEDFPAKDENTDQNKQIAAKESTEGVTVTGSSAGKQINSNESKDDNVKIEWIKKKVNFKKTGPVRVFNLDNMPHPPSLDLMIPESMFDPVEGKYSYNPAKDPFNINPGFSIMWRMPNNSNSIDLYRNVWEVPTVFVYRANREKSLQFIIYGAVPKSVRIKYNISSILYYPKLTDKTQEIKGKNVYNQVTEKALVIPDTLLPEEKIRLEFQNPFNYNLSKRGEKHDWKNPTNEVVIEHSNDTIIELDFEKIPPFQFFYIDLSGFENLQKIKDLLKEKIGEQNNDYFIFVSNSSRPLIWEGEENDLDELLTRISLMRPEPASYYDETRFIKPYIDEMINDESIYSIDRREVHFNFLFSESFLNHSSQDFILKCLDALTNDDFFKDGKVKVFSFSTTDKPAYVKTDHTMDKNKITYNKL